MKTKFKTITIFIMIIGIVQIISASDSEKNSNRISIIEGYNKKNDLKLIQAVLEDNWIFDINMLVTYSIEQNEYVPIESNSYLTGFVSGYNWKFNSINTTNLDKNGKAEFIANGILKWNLFGITIYSETKIFNGVINKI